jgi:hypothetical protein
MRCMWKLYENQWFTNRGAIYRFIIEEFLGNDLNNQ